MLALCYHGYVINVNLVSSNANTVSFKYIQYIKKLKQHNICYYRLPCCLAPLTNSSKRACEFIVATPNTTRQQLNIAQ